MEKDQGKFDWPKEAIIEMIHMWQTYECLYNPKHNFYHNKHARYQALDEIANKLKIFNPTIKANDIKNKLTYLRGQYTREVAKTKDRRSGAGAEDVYVSSAFWFDELSFLGDFIKIRKSTSNLLEPVEESWDASQVTEFEISPAQPSKKARVSFDTPLSSRSVSQEDTALAAATEALNNLTNFKKVFNEKNAAFSNYIKTELDDLKNENIRDQLMDTITLAVMEAKKQQRHYDNVIEGNFSNFERN